MIIVPLKYCIIIIIFKYCILYWIGYEIPMSIRSYILEKTIFFRPSRISQNISLLLFFIIVTVNDY